MDDMTLLGIKAAVAAGVAALTAVWGWFGWLVVAWVVCMLLDYGTGTAAALRAGEWSSKVARDGLWHKLGAVVAVLVAAILVFAKFNNEGFQILWRYFAWSNQTLSLFAFLAITVWMFENGKGKYAWMPMIPGGFYCFICSTYIANAKIGFNIPWTYAYIIGVVAAVAYVGVIIWYGRKRAAAHTLQH